MGDLTCPKCGAGPLRVVTSSPEVNAEIAAAQCWFLDVEEGLETKRASWATSREQRNSLLQGMPSLRGVADGRVQPPC